MKPVWELPLFIIDQKGFFLLDKYKSLSIDGKMQHTFMWLQLPFDLSFMILRFLLLTSF